MKRVPEPELMESEAQARAYAEADFEEPHSHMIELLCEALPALPASGVALDVGCGAADIGIRFARTFPGWSVDGVEGSPAMLSFAKAAIACAGLEDRVSVRRAYLPEDSPPRSSYDLLVSNALLHHLADPAVLWEVAKRWVKRSGQVFVMDLLRPSSAKEARALVDLYASEEPDVLRRDFYNSFLAAYTVEEVRAQLSCAGLRNLRVEQSSDRHFVVWGGL